MHPGFKTALPGAFSSATLPTRGVSSPALGASGVASPVPKDDLSLGLSPSVGPQSAAGDACAAAGSVSPLPGVGGFLSREGAGLLSRRISLSRTREKTRGRAPPPPPLTITPLPPGPGAVQAPPAPSPPLPGCEWHGAAAAATTAAVEPRPLFDSLCGALYQLVLPVFAGADITPSLGAISAVVSDIQASAPSSEVIQREVEDLASRGCYQMLENIMHAGRALPLHSLCLCEDPGGIRSPPSPALSICEPPSLVPIYQGMTEHLAQRASEKDPRSAGPRPLQVPLPSSIDSMPSLSPWAQEGCRADSPGTLPALAALLHERDLARLSEALAQRYPSEPLDLEGPPTGPVIDSDDEDFPSKCPLPGVATTEADLLWSAAAAAGARRSRAPEWTDARMPVAAAAATAAPAPRLPPQQPPSPWSTSMPPESLPPLLAVQSFLQGARDDLAAAAATTTALGGRHTPMHAPSPGFASPSEPSPRQMPFRMAHLDLAPSPGGASSPGPPLLLPLCLPARTGGHVPAPEPPAAHDGSRPLATARAEAGPSTGPAPRDLEPVIFRHGFVPGRRQMLVSLETALGDEKLSLLDRMRLGGPAAGPSATGAPDPGHGRSQSTPAGRAARRTSLGMDQQPAWGSRTPTLSMLRAGSVTHPARTMGVTGHGQDRRSAGAWHTPIVTLGCLDPPGAGALAPAVCPSLLGRLASPCPDPGQLLLTFADILDHLIESIAPTLEVALQPLLAGAGPKRVHAGGPMRGRPSTSPRAALIAAFRRHFLLPLSPFLVEAAVAVFGQGRPRAAVATSGAGAGARAGDAAPPPPPPPLGPGHRMPGHGSPAAGGQPAGGLAGVMRRRRLDPAGVRGALARSAGAGSGQAAAFAVALRIRRGLSRLRVLGHEQPLLEIGALGYVLTGGWRRSADRVECLLSALADNYYSSSTMVR
ncbi:hypothetical protein H696_00584 [Fonticula alba]|uniref:Uncharacterized protein n=1 Tax=Fonticula alba TaxID=691883 RepID=A0A058ZGF6_FONAL|nr:hypothetical protein H696_00584 [Fonticula alba]KCV73036.1 hypothetical protein H696_00584 [Fonticula alba]|eukprot:XP_009492737.1 hypothetical protein H696_00584 [Fonticula alba]